MKIEQIYTGCLAEAAYYIESNGEAAIIDPLREVLPYIEKAQKDNATIKYVFETHFHADFVSGHLDLAKKTGATIVYGPNAVTNFSAHIAKDNEVFQIGKIKIKVLHTPGHTMESSCFLLVDEEGKDYCIFTGDTLFIGDVGRPDLAIKSDVTKEDLAGYLYDSIHQKILTLQDDVIIYPGHGAGSACGKNMSKETVSTIGQQRLYNYALQAKTKEQFIEEVTFGLTPPPQYFPKNALMNKLGYDSLDNVYEKGLHALDPISFENKANELSALVLDTRHENDFIKAHIPNSIFIGLHSNFAPWVGELIVDIKQPILLICDDGKEQDAITRLARVGYDNTVGYLKGGIEAWQNAGKEVDTVENINANQLEKILQIEQPKVIDVRKTSEFEVAHIDNAKNMPLSYINEWIHHLSNNDTYFIHCAGGYRSIISISILKARGFHHLINIDGGFKAIEATKIPIFAGTV